VRGHRQKERKLGERKWVKRGVRKAAIQAHGSKEIKWRTYRILFGKQAKAVRDGRGSGEGKKRDPFPNNTRRADSTLYGK
jgi:hypothetical protein